MSIARTQITKGIVFSGALWLMGGREESARARAFFGRILCFQSQEWQWNFASQSLPHPVWVCSHWCLCQIRIGLLVPTGLFRFLFWNGKLSSQVACVFVSYLLWSKSGENKCICYSYNGRFFICLFSVCQLVVNTNGNGHLIHDALSLVCEALGPFR